MSFLSTQGGLNTRLAQWGDAIGRWNPQLLRELQGNLTIRSSVAAVTVAWGLQALLAYSVPRGAVANWHETVLLISRLLWIFLVALTGSVAISQNWVREAKLGTLDFLRLSPEPAWRILLGKMLGAPAPCFVAAIAWLPFHLYLVVASGVDLASWLAIDMFNVSVAIAFLSAVLALSTWAEKLNLVSVYILGDFTFLLLPMMLLGAIEADSGTAFPDGFWWFGLDLSQSAVLLLSWATAVMVAIAAFCWSAACRRFNKPNATPLLRRQVYLMFAAFNGIFLGFFIPITEPLDPGMAGGWAAIAVLWTMLQAFAIFGSMPSRQQLIDWGRYQHFLRQNPQARNTQNRNTQKQRMSQYKRARNQLIWNSNSPPFMVPVANLAITWVIWSPWAIALASNDSPGGVFLLFGLGITTAILTTITGISVWIAIKIPRAQKFWIAAIAITCMTFLFSFGFFGVGFAGLLGLGSIPASLISVGFARGAIAHAGKSESKLLFEDAPPNLQ